VLQRLVADGAGERAGRGAVGRGRWPAEARRAAALAGPRPARVRSPVTMVHQEGVGPSTYRLEGGCSIPCATGARARGSPGVGGVTRPPPGRGWSGRRDSNPRHTAWKAVALPTELLPRASEAVVGAARFELATPCSQSRCATRLRYAPTRTA